MILFTGYKYGVVTKVYTDKDRIKVFTIDEEGEDDEILYYMEEDKNLKEDGAFATDEYGRKTDKKATVEEGSPVKFKLNKKGEIAEDKLWVMDMKNVWKIRAKDDFGKDYLPIARLYNEDKYKIDDSEAGISLIIPDGGKEEDVETKETFTFSADDKTVIIDAETFKFENKWTPTFDSSEFGAAKWKDLKDANGIEGYFYVFADDDRKVNAKAVIFIGEGSGAASDDEIGIYVINTWLKGGDKYVKYHAYDGEVEEIELDDEDSLYEGKEHPYVAKVKSNGKLDIIRPGKADDFDIYYGQVEKKDSSSLTMYETFDYADDSDVGREIFNISNKTLVYEEDDKRTTSSIKKDDVIIMVVEKGSNVRVVERLIDSEAKKMLDKIDNLRDPEKIAEEAAAVDKMIEDLPAVDDLEYSDKAAVEAAREAYDNLSGKAKDAVKKENVEKLEALEEKMKEVADGKAQAEAVKAVVMAVAGKDEKALAKALANDLFENVKEDNMAKYLEAEEFKQLSVASLVADVNKAIEAVNGNVAQAEAVKAVVMAVAGKDKKALAKALANDLFENVKEDNMAEYLVADEFKGLSVDSSVKDVNDAIETVNKQQADQTKIDAAIELVPDTIELEIADGDNAEDDAKTQAVKAHVEELVKATENGLTVKVEAGSTSGYKVTISISDSEATAGVKDNVTVTFTAPSGE